VSGPTSTLLSFLHELRYEDLSAPLVSRAEELFLDWTGSALAGCRAVPVHALRRFTTEMGPASGPCELLGTSATTSAWFAALVNGAASHVVEQDDLHSRSVLHPGTVVFPAALATAQTIGASGRRFLTAVVAGYEAGARLGEMLGRSHYKVFHTTGTAGTVAAAVAVAHLLGLDVVAFRNALGSAGTQAAGLWAFLRDAADSKQLHTAKAAADGLLAAYTAQAGLAGAKDVLLGPQGMAEAMSRDPRPQALTEDLGRRWAVMETSFKWHASCRHTHPAADAMLQLVTENDLNIQDITHVDVRTYQAAIDVLGPVRLPESVHQSKFCMGFVLALIARYRSAGIDMFSEQNLKDQALLDFAANVEMVLDAAVDSAYPNRWMSAVKVHTQDGRSIEVAVKSAKGDPDNPLTRKEIEEKFLRLANWGGVKNLDHADRLFQRIYQLHSVSADLRAPLLVDPLDRDLAMA